MKNKLATGLATAALAGLPAAPLLSATRTGDAWGHHGMMGGSGWFMGPIMMLLMLIIVVAVVVLVVRWLGGTPSDTGLSAAAARNSKAKAILEERFARGEIDEEEFRRRKQALEE